MMCSENRSKVGIKVSKNVSHSETKIQGTSCASARSVSARDTGLTSRVKGVHTKCADQFCGCCVSVWRVALSAFVEPMNVMVLRIPNCWFSCMVTVFFVITLYM